MRPASTKLSVIVPTVVHQPVAKKTTSEPNRVEEIELVYAKHSVGTMAAQINGAHSDPIEAIDADT